MSKHLKLCQCRECARSRVIALEVSVREKVNNPRMPRSADESVFVRGHFRRQPNYMNKDPAGRKLWEAFIEGLTRGMK